MIILRVLGSSSYAKLLGFPPVITESDKVILEVTSF